MPQPAIPTGPQGPLTSDHYRQINERLTELAALSDAIRQAQEAGTDCQQRPEMCAYLRQRLAQIKSTYFPHRP